MNKAEFNEAVTELIERTKAGDPELLDRQNRIKIIDELIEDYVKATGKVPEPYELERVGSLILREELTDSHPDKMSREDDPIMSNDQYARRTEGRHRKKSVNKRIEIGFNATQTIAVDGQDYRMPLRRTTE
jgi:hypothetical protein